MLCLIAAEPQAAEVIKRNLEKSGRYPDWRFEAVTGAEELERFPEQPDVLAVSRFLPGKDPLVLLKGLRRLFPSAHVVLLAGQDSEARRAYVRGAERLGYYNIVTGKLPGDPPYTVFTALTQAKRPDLEGYARIGEEADEAAGAPEEGAVAPAAAERRPEPEARAREPASAAQAGSRTPSPSGSASADLRSLKEALEAGDLDALRAGLARVLAQLEGGGAQERMERVSDRRGVLVLVAANKGGVGKTTVAAAVATALAQAGVPTVAVDLDFRGPDLAVLFGIKAGSAPGIEALAGKPIREGLVRDLIVSVRGGPDVLPGPQDGTVPALSGREVTAVLEVLRGMYAVVVGDTPPGSWSEPWLSGVFELADYVLAVVNQSVQSEEDTRRFAPLLLAAGVTPERIGIVLNMYSPKLHNPRRVEEVFCSGFRKSVRTLPRIVAVIPADWESFVREGYKGEVPGLGDARHAWHKLAAEIAVMAGYSYREKEDGRRSTRRPLLGLFGRR